MAESQFTNAPELTVSELSGALKRAIEDQFGYVRVRGEISDYRGPHTSGHAYFCLKDSAARIDAVVWKGTFVPHENQAAKRAWRSSPPARSPPFRASQAYQIVIEQLEPAGVGALMALLEERRKKFAAEGLFDAARKQKAALSAARHRHRHLADRRGDPRHPAPPRRPLPAPRAGLAGAGAGRNLGRRSRRGHRGFNALTPGRHNSAARPADRRARRRFARRPLELQRGEVVRAAARAQFR